VQEASVLKLLNEVSNGGNIVGEPGHAFSSPVAVAPLPTVNILSGGKGLWGSGLGDQLSSSPTPDAQDEMQWSCKRCTMLNKGNFLVCEMCETPKTWIDEHAPQSHMSADAVPFSMNNELVGVCVYVYVCVCVYVCVFVLYVDLHAHICILCHPLTHAHAHTHTHT
jgi:hypothetical protein